MEEGKEREVERKKKKKRKRERERSERAREGEKPAREQIQSVWKRYIFQLMAPLSPLHTHSHTQNRGTPCLRQVAVVIGRDVQGYSPKVGSAQVTEPQLCARIPLLSLSLLPLFNSPRSLPLTPHFSIPTVAGSVLTAIAQKQITRQPYL